MKIREILLALDLKAKNVSNADHGTYEKVRKELYRFNVKSMIVRLKMDQNVRLIYPCLVKNQDGELFLVKGRSDNGLHLSNDDVLPYDVVANEFVDEILLFEKIDSVQVSEIVRNSFATRMKMVLLIFVLICFSFLLTSKPSFSLYSFFFLDLAGLILALSYFLKENKFSNSIYEYVCKPSSIAQCTGEKYEVIYGFSFAVLGCIYFLFSIFSLIVIDELPFQFPLVFKIVNLLGIPLLIYSIIVQTTKNKVMCMICSIILLIFIGKQIFIFWHLSPYPASLRAELVSLLLVIISASILSLWEKTMSESKTKNKLKRQFDNIWSEWSTFSRFLVKYDSEPSPLKKNILVGNPNAENQIDLLIHVSCKYCKDALSEMMNLVRLNDNYKVNIFIKNDGETRDVLYLNKFIADCRDEKLRLALTTYLEWKENEEIIEEMADSFSEEVESNSNFFRTNSIEFFPEIRVNGYYAPTFMGYDNMKIALAQN